MGEQGTTTELPGYTVLQPSSILTTAINSAAITDPSPISSSLSLPHPNHSTSTITTACTVDTHTCGSCNSQFTELKAFVDHKQQGCHVIGPELLNQGQTTTLMSTHNTSQPLLTSAPLVSPSLIQPGTIIQSGPNGTLPMGMHHIILHPSSNSPAQVYRVVLDQSVNLSNSSTYAPIADIQSNLTDTTQEQFTTEIIENQSVKSEIRDDSSNIIRLTSVSEDWHTNRNRDDNVNYETSQNSTSSLVTSHTEEDEVAKFLATQLRGQNSSVNASMENSSTLESSLQYTAAPSHFTKGVKQPAFVYQTVDEIGQKEENNEISTINQNMYNKCRVVQNKKCLKTVKSNTCSEPNCNYSCNNTTDLKRHMRSHTGEKPFECKECLKRFTRKDKLIVHTRTHTNEKPYPCTEPGCNYRAIDSGGFKKHLRIHTGERPYKCQICPYRAKENSQLIVHLRSHTGDTPFHCPYEGCPSSFKTSSDLKRHIRTHTGEKPYKCNVCEYAATLKCNLILHIKTNHYQGTRFNCSKCNQKYTNRRQLREHEKQHSKDGLKCSFCHHISTSDCGLRVHMSSHMREKNYRCQFCSFTSRTSRLLNHHVTSKHSNDLACRKKTLVNLSQSEYNYQCESVNEINTTESQTSPLTKSMGKKIRKPSCHYNYKCEHCGSGFVRPDSYKCHLRQHKKNEGHSEIELKEAYDLAENKEETKNNGGVNKIKMVVVNHGEVTKNPPLSNHYPNEQCHLNINQNAKEVEVPTSESTGNAYNYVITIGEILEALPTPMQLPNEESQLGNVDFSKQGKYDEKSN